MTERRSFSRPLGQRLWGDAPRAIPPLLAAPAQAIYPLTQGQEQLWIVDVLGGNRSVYNVCQAYALRGELDTAALRRALAALVERHQSLRLRFVERDGRPIMSVDPSATLTLAEVDLRRRASELAVRLDSEARAPFDLGRAPLLRVTLYRLGEAEYALQFTSQHLIEDGATRGTIARDLGRLYEEIALGGPPLAPLALQFGDFALWQRAVLEGEALEKQRAFWRDALALPRGYAEFPADRPRGAVDDHRGARYRHQIDARTLERVRALGRAHGASTFMTLAAAYLALLHRYSGETDTIVGFPTAGRMLPETAPIAGCFVNTLALRADFSGDPTFRAHLERVRDFALEAYDNQDLPFNRIIEDLGGDRSLARAPLFSTMISLVERDRGTLALPGLEVTPLEVDAGVAVSDLRLELREAAGGLSAFFEYNRALFERATVARIARHFEALLRAVLDDPDLPVSRVRLLDEAERGAILALGSGDFQTSSPVRPFHELFEEQAARTPDRLALEFGDERLDYRELDARANALARELRDAGAAPGSVVGACFERSTELLVALLAILKAGAAFLPLDTSLPGERVRFMLEETGSKIVLARRAESARLAGIDATLLLVDARPPDAGPTPNAGNLGIRLEPEALAYVLYTSGSTGRPKGVLLPQRAFSNHMLWMRDAGLVRADDRALQKTPIGFDVALWECFAPLLAGACVVLADPDAHKDPAAIVEAIIERRITVTSFVPAMLRLVVEDPRLPECETLRRVLSAGEALPLEVARRFAERSGAELHNLYGPTETTIHSTAWLFDPNAERVLIGRPISRTVAYVLDAWGEPAPLGVAGELCIGGAGVALGYLARPELTAAAFVDDRFAGAGKLYRTGDRARMLPDGNLEYLGRRDRQVKLRGLRIEPGEIESVLAAHPGVSEAAVVVYELAEAGPTLAAYVAMRSGATLDAKALRAHAAERLPDYMLPALWTPLAALPKTTGGKIDYRAFPPPAGIASANGDPPQGATECAIAEVWSELLGRNDVGRGESFFALGGHSLLAMRALSRINQRFGVTLGFAAFFREPTIAALGAEIARLLASATAPDSSENERIEELLDPAELAEIRAQLAQLDDDAIETLLLQALGET